MKTIPVYVTEDSHQEPEAGDQLLGMLGPEKGETKKIRFIDTEKLKGSARDLTEQLSQIFADLKAVGDFKLQEVTVSIEVSAEGSLILVGKAGISGGISLKFAP